MSEIQKLEENLDVLFCIQDMVNADILMINDLLQSYMGTSKYPFEFSSEITELTRELEKAKKAKKDLTGKINLIIDYKNTLIGSYSESISIFVEY